MFPMPFRAAVVSEVQGQVPQSAGTTGSCLVGTLCAVRRLKRHLTTMSNYRKVVLTVYVKQSSAVTTGTVGPWVTGVDCSVQ